MQSPKRHGLYVRHHPATQFSGPVTEAIDTVRNGRISHLLAGAYADVLEHVKRLRVRYPKAVLVAQHGQSQEDHFEAVVHRPAPAPREATGPRNGWAPRGPSWE